MENTSKGGREQGGSKSCGTSQSRLVMTNQSDIMVIDKHQKTAVVIDIVNPSGRNVRKMEHEMLEKHQGLKEELECESSSGASSVMYCLRLSLRSHICLLVTRDNFYCNRIYINKVELN